MSSLMGCRPTCRSSGRSSRWGGYIVYWIPIVGTLLAGVAFALNGASQLWDKPLQQTFADKFAKTVVVKIK